MRVALLEGEHAGVHAFGLVHLECPSSGSFLTLRVVVSKVRAADVVLVLLRVLDDFITIFFHWPDALDVRMKHAASVANHVEERAVPRIAVIDRLVIVQVEVIVTAAQRVGWVRVQLVSDAVLDERAT